jgi:hypothetical protein
MVKDTKRNVLVAVGGAIVGAGAVLASVVAMKDKRTQKKVGELVANAKQLISGYKNQVDDQVETKRATIKKVATKAIKTAEKVTKSAKKEVKKI